MRTTMTIDDDLMAELRDTAHRRQVPMRRLIDQTLRAGLRSLGTRKARRVACPAFSMGTPAVDLDKAGALAALLEDEEIARKLELRK
jgi:hypothetical protein